MHKTRPKDFKASLKSKAYKTALIKFLIQEWKDDKYAEVMQGKRVIATHAKVAQSYRSEGGKVYSSEVPMYCCGHIEADTRIVYHLCQIKSGSNVVVRASDTDILILLLFFISQLDLRVWMETGRSSDNTRRYIDINNLANHLGSQVCKALPGLHALTGCDYESSFARKGKIRPLQIARGNDDFLKGLSMLGEEITPDLGSSKTIEHFVLTLYGIPKATSVNTARKEIFEKKYKPKKNKLLLSSITGLDATMLTPCHDCLTQKIKRTNYIVRMWKRSSDKNPLDGTPSPTEQGWEEKDGVYKPVWFTGDQLPTDLSKHIEERHSDEFENEFTDIHADSSDSDDSETDESIP